MKRKFLPKNYGIYIISIWSFALAVQGIITIVYTVKTQGSVEVLLPKTQIGLYQTAVIIFSIAFFIAAIGLWLKANWGRWLFLITCSIYFIISIVGLFISNNNTIGIEIRALLAVRYVVSLILPLIYLNLPFIKEVFEKTTQSSK